MIGGWCPSSTRTIASWKYVVKKFHCSFVFSIVDLVILIWYNFLFAWIKTNFYRTKDKLATKKKNKLFYCVKSVRIRSYSGPHFPAFGLNTERYGISLRTQSECGKMRTRTTPNTDAFHAVQNHLLSWVIFFRLTHIFIILSSLRLYPKFIRFYLDEFLSHFNVQSCYCLWSNWTHPSGQNVFLKRTRYMG